MKGEITLYAPELPHMPVLVKASLLRRLHIKTSPFATPWEMAKARPRPRNRQIHRPRR
jgi:hypothetical protein